jgi:FKBP-type peptidyl-prolyl cis-trans isomerase SlyD
MKIKKDRVAVLDYTLTGDDNEVIDASNDGSFAYLHGAGNIIPGLERALTGKRPGETVQVVIEAADAYGERDPARVLRLPRSSFPDGMTVAVGSRFLRRAADGREVVASVVGLEGDQVMIDMNHPLAGRRLQFSVTVLSVRSARKEEIAHGHVHRPGDHHH